MVAGLGRRQLRLCPSELSAQPRLLPLKQIKRDRPGEVRLQEACPLVVEACDRPLGAVDHARPPLLLLRQVLRQRQPEPGDVALRHLEAPVGGEHLALDGVGRQVRLVAAIPAVPSEAVEVAIALGRYGERHPRAAAVAGEQALEVMAVALLAVAGLVVGAHDRLDALEEPPVDQRLVPTLVSDAAVTHVPAVVRVLEHPVQL
ncbi:MAG: hypothetical protein M3P93_15860 [Actinomycetota bacterium]|nr:hypothetical protein [Actinomycetota bacterium]